MCVQIGINDGLKRGRYMKDGKTLGKGSLERGGGALCVDDLGPNL